MGKLTKTTVLLGLVLASGCASNAGGGPPSPWSVLPGTGGSLITEDRGSYGKPGGKPGRSDVASAQQQQQQQPSPSANDLSRGDFRSDADECASGPPRYIYYDSRTNGEVISKRRIKGSKRYVYMGAEPNSC